MRRLDRVEDRLDAADEPGELLDRADRLAVATCVETQRSGMIRSEIAAHSLRSRILLRQGDTVGAQEQARQAVPDALCDKLLIVARAHPALHAIDSRGPESDQTSATKRRVCIVTGRNDSRTRRTRA